jgi:hypothetical protein
MITTLYLGDKHPLVKGRRVRVVGVGLHTAWIHLLHREDVVLKVPETDLAYFGGAGPRIVGVDTRYYGHAFGPAAVGARVRIVGAVCASEGITLDDDEEIMRVGGIQPEDMIGVALVRHDGTCEDDFEGVWPAELARFRGLPYPVIPGR